jgi:hypothetical protein
MEFTCPIKNENMIFINHKKLDDYFENKIMKNNEYNYKIDEIKVSKKSLTRLDPGDCNILMKRESILLTFYNEEIEKYDSEKLREIKFAFNFPFHYLLLKLYDASFWFYYFSIKISISKIKSLKNINESTLDFFDYDLIYNLNYDFNLSKEIRDNYFDSISFNEEFCIFKKKFKLDFNYYFYFK